MGCLFTPTLDGQARLYTTYLPLFPSDLPLFPSDLNNNG